MLIHELYFFDFFKITSHLLSAATYEFRILARKITITLTEHSSVCSKSEIALAEELREYA